MQCNPRHSTRLVFVKSLLEGEHGHDENAAVPDEREPRVVHGHVRQPEQRAVLQHELVQEVAVGVEDGNHEPRPLEGTEERHLSLLGRAVSHAYHLLEHKSLMGLTAGPVYSRSTGRRERRRQTRPRLICAWQG